MLQFRVFAAHHSRPSLPSPSPFLPCTHSTPFFSMNCALFSATDASQPFLYQSLPHSFSRDGGLPLSASSISPVSTRRCIQLLCFHTLPHSFAHAKIITLFFSIDSALFAKNNRGWGYPPSLQSLRSSTGDLRSTRRRPAPTLSGSRITPALPSAACCIIPRRRRSEIEASMRERRNEES
jgi:hypothetical protein